MIRHSCDIIHLQAGCQFLYRLAAQAVDDARFAFHLTDKFNDVFIYVLRLLTHFIHQIGAVETRFEHSGTLHA